MKNKYFTYIKLSKYYRLRQNNGKEEHMKSWTSKQLKLFNEISAIQNRPYNDDGVSFQDNPIWVVVNGKQVYLRGGKGTDSKWYQAGIKNGGEIEVAGQTFKVKYVPVDNESEIAAVTVAYNQKYHGQYPIDMMVSDKVAHATVRLELR